MDKNVKDRYFGILIFFIDANELWILGEIYHISILYFKGQNIPTILIAQSIVTECSSFSLGLKKLDQV